MNYKQIEDYCATGRRKSAVARVRLYPGSGKFTVNGSEMVQYFNLSSLRFIINQPLVSLDVVDKFDIICTVKGGGVFGQAGALRHGISRALVKFNCETMRPKLKRSGFLTRDSRLKERKKYGLKAARKRPQFSKR